RAGEVGLEGVQLRDRSDALLGIVQDVRVTDRVEVDVLELVGVFSRLEEGLNGPGPARGVVIVRGGLASELSASVLILPWAADLTARDDTFRVAAAARVAVRGDVDAEPPVLTVVVATRGAQAPEVHDLDGLALAGRRDHREIVCARGVPLGAAGVHDRLLVHQ